MKQIVVHPPKTGSKITQHQFGKIANQAQRTEPQTDLFF